MENNYRIHTNIGSDTVLKVNLTQDMDFLEVLSLKISQEDTYRLDNSNYGVIVGRVLANDAFGIPNAKISVFIPIEDEDIENNDIYNLYMYKTTSDKNADNIRYNLLPNDSDDDCYKIVGTFPTKRLVLDDNTVLEVFDKYYKYNTVTNNSGDYMIYGVPTGNTQLHVDIDLSDVGILSQKPRDFIYKGYTETQFDNANQFKDSTNLDNLTQIISQDQSVYVYPFFGEEGAEDVAITRCDVQVQYKFEPTCYFMGAIFSDSYGNNIGPTCTPNKNIGKNSELVAGYGTIEMIRKTIDGLTEEFPIQGNQLIDGDGVWCYQIPMNLDYVGTDEYGNIVPTDNPSKGIPTRTRVRFRFTMSETENDAMSRHRAKYLVPNNPLIMHDKEEPTLSNQDAKEYEKHFNFGSTTLDEDYRNLYWNKVYSVKNYIPRLQTNGKVQTKNHSGLRTANEYGSKNPFPYNKARMQMPFSYRLVCVITKIVIDTIFLLNSTVIAPLSVALSGGLCNVKFIRRLIKSICNALTLPCIPFGAGLTESDSNEVFYPGCWNKASLEKSKCPEGMNGCKKRTSMSNLYDIVEQVLAEDYDIVHLDFYNDWLNGSLYFPLWYWKKTKMKSYFFGLFRKKGKNKFCDCDKYYKHLQLMESCAMRYTEVTKNNEKRMLQKKKKFSLFHGIIKNIENKDGLNLYYYTPGNMLTNNLKELLSKGDNIDFARLFATDIILLGSFNSCDTEGVPQPFNNLPATTANLVDMKRVMESDLSDEDTNAEEGSEEEVGDMSATGMDWLNGGKKTTPSYSKGLFFGIDCNEVLSIPKTCINLNRISELGVTRDLEYSDDYMLSSSLSEEKLISDGLITKVELDDYETRAMFATLNHNGLEKLKVDPSTSYKIYDFNYLYPTDFDGRYTKEFLNTLKYNTSTTKDLVDVDYMTFRYGPDFVKAKSKKDDKIHFYGTKDKDEFFPLFNNSFYFYFGINEGNTAIEKFRKKFTATCFKNVKYPFTVDISKESARWCTKTDKDYGVINAYLPDIKTPYSYELRSKSSGELLISETNVKLNRLIFGVALSGNEKYSSGTDYVSNDGSSYVKDGSLHYFENYPNKVLNDKDEEVKLVNGIYLLKITDINGRSQEITITLAQTPLSLDYKSTDLGTKFMPQENNDLTVNTYTTHCDIYDNGNDGEIELKKVVIDNIEYDITKMTYVKQDGLSDIYDLDLKSATDEQKVQLKITIKEVLFIKDIRYNADSSTFVGFACENGKHQCDCDQEGCSGKTTIDLTEHIFYVWVPGSYEFKLTQYCNDKLNDNVSSNVITINNGVPFQTYLNTVPTTFLNNTNFVPIIQKSHAMASASVPSGWYSINKETTYSFPQIAQNENIWSDYIPYTVLYDDNGNKFCDAETKLNALLYKFESIFKLSNATFFTDNGENTFELSTKGGKNAIKQGCYPAYSEFNEIINEANNDKLTNVSILNKWTLDNDAYVSCDAAHPDIVYGETYQFWYRNNKSKSSFHLASGNKANDLIGGAEADRFNYFAAFSNPMIKNEEIIYREQFLKHQKNQPISNTYTAKNETPSSHSGVIKHWLSTRFIDRRLGYNAILFTATPTLIELLGEDYCMGRFCVQTLNGIDMAYDDPKTINSGKTYNIIEKRKNTPSELYEYYYLTDELKDNNKDVKTYYTTPNVKQHKMFYNATLSVKGNVFDIKYGLYNKTFNDKYFILQNNSEIERSSGMFVPYPYYGYYNDASNDYNAEIPKRFIDVRDISLGGVTNLNIQSCSYDVGLETSDVVRKDDDSLDVDIIGTIKGGELVDVTLDANSMLNLTATDINDCAATGNFNILYNSGGNPFAMRCKAKLGGDSYIDGLVYAPYKPFIKVYEDKSKLQEELKETKFKLDNPYVIYDTLKSEGTIFKIQKNDEIKDEGGKYIFKSSNGEALISDDDVIDNVVLYVKSTNRGLHSIWSYTEDDIYGKNKYYAIPTDKKIISIYCGREYFDEDNINNLLYRRFEVIDFSHIYELNRIKINDFDLKISGESGTVDLSGTTNTDVEITISDTISIPDGKGGSSDATVSGSDGGNFSGTSITQAENTDTLVNLEFNFAVDNFPFNFELEDVEQENGNISQGRAVLWINNSKIKVEGTYDVQFSSPNKVKVTILVDNNMIKLIEKYQKEESILQMFITDGTNLVHSFGVVFNFNNVKADSSFKYTGGGTLKGNGLK